MLTVDRRQALAYRIAAQELHRPHGDPAALAVLTLGVQETQNHSARLAMAARLDIDPAALAPGAFGELVEGSGLAAAWTHRGAPHLHRAAELHRIAGAMVPLDEDDARARLSWQRRDVEGAGMPVTKALTVAAEAMRTVTDRTMTKGAASEAVTKILPDGLNRWCRGCQATHIHEQVMRLVTLRAGLRLEADVSPATLTPVGGWGPVTDEPDEQACTEVVRHYLTLHGPGTVADAAGFVTTTRKVAQRMWPADELAEVELDGKSAFLPSERLGALQNPPEPDFLRLLPPSDPLLQSRDRLTLVPDKEHHKAIWRIIGNPGAVLEGGEINGVWRAKAKGRKALEVTISPFWPLRPASRAAAEHEAARMAAARGLPTSIVRFE